MCGAGRLHLRLTLMKAHVPAPNVLYLPSHASAYYTDKLPSLLQLCTVARPPSSRLPEGLQHQREFLPSRLRASVQSSYFQTGSFPTRGDNTAGGRYIHASAIISSSPYTIARQSLGRSMFASNLSTTAAAVRSGTVTASTKSCHIA
jgi:hypothetical protein